MAARSASGARVARKHDVTAVAPWCRGVFLDRHGSDLTGHCTCLLHLGDGSTVSAGMVPVYHGAGDWARTVTVTVSQLRTATLVTTRWVSVASATFY